MPMCLRKEPWMQLGSGVPDQVRGCHPCESWSFKNNHTARPLCPRSRSKICTPIPPDDASSTGSSAGCWLCAVFFCFSQRSVQNQLFGRHRPACPTHDRFPHTILHIQGHHQQNANPVTKSLRLGNRSQHHCLVPAAWRVVIPGLNKTNVGWKHALVAHQLQCQTPLCPPLLQQLSHNVDNKEVGGSKPFVDMVFEIHLLTKFFQVKVKRSQKKSALPNCIHRNFVRKNPMCSRTGILETKLYNRRVGQVILYGCDFLFCCDFGQDMYFVWRITRWVPRIASTKYLAQGNSVIWRRIQKLPICKTLPISCPKFVGGVHGKDMLDVVGTEVPCAPSVRLVSLQFKRRNSSIESCIGLTSALRKCLSCKIRC